MYYFSIYFLIFPVCIANKSYNVEKLNSPYKVAVWFENWAGLASHQTFPVLVAQVYIVLS